VKNEGAEPTLFAAARGPRAPDQFWGWWASHGWPMAN